MRRACAFLLLGLLGLATPVWAQREAFANNAASTLASGIAGGDLSLTVQTGDGALFPAISGSDYFYVVLEDTPVTKREIVKVTARSTDTFTIVRAQQGYTAQSFSTGHKVELRVTKGSLESLQSVIATSLDMNGETEKRFTITDTTVGANSKIAGSIRRPDVTDTDDEGWKYGFNIVTLAAGSFDVVVWLEDPDDDLRPPTETITLWYLVR